MLGKTFMRNNFGHAQIIEIPVKNKYGYKLMFANMIAQNGLPDKNHRRCLNYQALVKSMTLVGQFIKNFQAQSENQKIEIHTPKFGSGIAGGNWNFISDLIEDIWGNYDVFVYTYNKQNQKNS